MLKIYNYYPEAITYEIDDFESLKQNLKALTEEELELVYKAYLVAEKYHKNSPHRISNGKAYITHPLTVANIIAKYAGDGVECNMVCAALLHDTIEDTDYTLEELKKDFGNDVLEIVDTVTKISKASNSITDKEKARDATHRKILESARKYGRNGILGMMLKIVDRIHNIQSLDGFDLEKRNRIATETLHIYVPIARISGMYEAKDFLENISLMNLDIDNFEKYFNLRKQLINDTKDICNEFYELIFENLMEKNIPFNYKVKVKNLYSIYKQIEERSKKIEQINDLLGMKFIVPTLDDCYRTIGVIHNNATPIKGYFDDYIASPKPNGYRSINTLIKYKDNKIQARIRSLEMERCNRLGLMFKDNPSTDSVIKGIQNSIELINKEDPTDKEFILEAEKNILRPKITILAPTGKRIEMYDGDTALEYALKAHLVKSQNEIDRIYVNGKKLDNFNEYLSDEDLVYVLRKEK